MNNAKVNDMTKEQYTRLIEAVIKSPRNDLQKINMLKQSFEFYVEENSDNTVIFPQTIGNLTYHSKEDLFEWVTTQQELNKKFIELNMN